MNSEHVILCGGLKPKDTGGTPGLELNAWPGAGRTNVRLDILDLNEKFCTTVPGRSYDLLDIATYVFQGDQMFSRGKLDVDNFGSRWRRHLHYHIPVREPDFWKTTAVQKALRDTLEFLSDDFYGFCFYPGKGAPEMQDYFKFGHTVAGMQAPELVTLFSGGLDSLGGAIHEIVRNKHHVALVNHQSTDKFGRTYEELLKRLRAKCGVFQPMHLRVEVNKKGIEAKDHYQRARSFLFAALGGTVAMMLGLRELRFYENGVLSLNLPICGQLVGARATRTTHPRVIAGYQDLLTLLAGEKFTVKTPFLWHTKGDVVKEILGADCGSLIPFSRSCAHTWQTDNTEPHCGTCSQCLDRRIAMLAAHGEQHDPLDRYATDVFIQARPKKEDKILGAGYIERANQVTAMRVSGEFLSRYPEVARVLRFTGMNPGAALERIFNLYRSHAAEVKEAVKGLVAQHSMAIVERTLPGDCLLRSVIESGSVTSTPMQPPAAKATPTNGVVKGVYALKKDLGVWRLNLNGQHALLEDDRAVSIVAYLLRNPPTEPMHAVPLEVKVWAYAAATDGLLEVRKDAEDYGLDDLTVTAGELSGAKLNAGDNKLLKEKIRELLATVEDESLPMSERDDAQAELDTIRQSLMGKAGRAGADNASRAVDRVRKGISRLHTKLAAANDENGQPHRVLRDFAEHLNNKLLIPSARFNKGKGSRNRAGVAGTFTYEPPPGVVWER